MQRGDLMARILRYAALSAVAFSAFLWVNNTALFSTARGDGKPALLAHRGIAQRFDTKGIDGETCTATRMLPPVHDYLENTIASLQASFSAGADINELDIHPTTDGQFAVFHDWTVDCRTDGRGVTREQSMEVLKKLDIGYGYTADGGKTFPFRGKGIGMMPTLEEVLTAFPRGNFLINIKSRDPAEGELLAAALGRLSPERRRDLTVFGHDIPVAVLRAALPDIRTVTRTTALACLKDYAMWGWTGIVPEACRKTTVYVPINYAPWLWGWPDRFLNRMDDAGSAVFVIGPYGGSGFSSGIDTPEDLARLPPGYSGGIMTNEIEAIAKAFAKPAISP